MPKTVKDLLAEASAIVPRISQQDAARMLLDGAVLLDVRDAPEITATGKAEGAVSVSRGMLEFRADPTSELYDDRLKPDIPVIIYCAAGGRAALAGKTLKDLGYARVYNLGGFKDWVENGGAVA
ncbi:MAG: rhodanese-like domain-containing protein [Pseudomonadota bacterium]